MESPERTGAQSADGQSRSFIEVYEHEPLDSAAGLRLARVSGSREVSEHLTVITKIYAWDRMPHFHYIFNDLAFNQDQITLILLNDRPYPLAIGISYFLRHFRQRADGRDFLVFAPTLCLTVEETEDEKLLEKARSQVHVAIDAMSLLNDLSDQQFKELQSPRTIPAERLPSTQASISFEPYRRQYAWRVTAQIGMRWSTRHYRHLDRSLNEVRLLRITLDGDKPEFDLINKPLADVAGRSSSYDALSYCWGTGQAVLEIAGEPLNIGQSAYDYLQYQVQLMIYVQKQSEEPIPPQLIWIDAVCINQQDPLEKVLQIKMMGMIYAKANSVQVWLGHTDEMTANALRGWTGTELRQKRERKGNAVLEAEAIRQSPEEAKALARVFLRPYFTRAWPIQELVFANPDKTWICMGGTLSITRWATLATFSPHFVDREELVPVVDGLDASDETKSSFMSGFIFARTQMIERMQARKSAGKTTSLLSLLLATLNLQSTIGKDKIYSLWSLADDADLCVVDYHQSDGKLFGDFTRAWIDRYRRLDILSVRSMASDRSTTDCPTWAVDWADEARITKPFVSTYPSAMRDDRMDEVETIRVYSAAKDTEPVVCWIGGGTRLLTAGISCDTVRAVGSMGRMPIKATLHNWHLFVQQHLPGMESDFHNALVANRDPLGDRLTGEVRGVGAFFRDVTPQDLGSMRGILSDIPGIEPSASLEGHRLCQRQHIFSVILGRRLAVTEGGHVGLVPYDAEPGDEIAVIFGCSVPIVVRHQAGNIPLIVGDCFFHRMMDGQMVDVIDDDTDLLSKIMSLQELYLDKDTGLDGSDGEMAGKADPALSDQFSTVIEAAQQARKAERGIYARSYLF